MERLIDFRAPEVQTALPVLLQDKSTKRNIIWATDPPEALRDGTDDKSEITIPQLQQMGYEAILPRMMKQADTQQERTRKKGEVFSPAWVCNKMNNALDADWFGLDAPKSLFTEELPQSWQTTPEPVPFDNSHKWEKYVDSRRLEVTCGEAPFLASRYDAATGEMIPVGRRIGILDRKLRVVGENTSTEADWLKWAIRAMQSTYGYEYQGDNLLLARTNLLLTFAEYLQARWGRLPTTKELHTVANIIAWNVWQMDGLHLSVPGGKPQPETEQLDFFSMFGAAEEQPPAISCKVKDWRANKTQDFETIQEGSTSMKFDYVIGNPPYQDGESESTRKPPVYNFFMDAAYLLADKAELITPARFLFDAGQTPKAWNKKMLNDEHLKALYFEPDGSKIFPNTDIKGGVVITYHDNSKKFGAIGAFTAYPELNNILKKVTRVSSKFVDSIMSQRGCYRFSEQFFQDFPDAAKRMGAGSGNMIVSNIFDKVPEAFFEEESGGRKGYVKLLGRSKSSRVYRYLDRKYIINNDFIDTYNVFVPEANGSGALGEVLSTPIVGWPSVGHTDTFLSIGKFASQKDAENCLKYIKTKFARTMLGTQKATQHNPPSTWKFVPVPPQEIDWSKSIAEIDQQLYRKYGLTADEINFIETHVKEMA